MKQKVQVIMLATTIEKATYPKSLMKCIQSYDGGWIDNFHNKVDKGELFYGFSDLTQGIWELQHLYFISNEEIKEGDWYIDNNISDPQKCESDYHSFELQVTSSKEIVATTDKSLNLPLIPESFIKKFVESNGSIKEVEIERKICKRHEKIVTNVDYPCTCLGTLQPLKVNSNNEVIICKEEKTVFTKEEIINILHKFNEHFGDSAEPLPKSLLIEWFNEQNF